MANQVLKNGDSPDKIKKTLEVASKDGEQFHREYDLSKYSIKEKIVPITNETNAKIGVNGVTEFTKSDTNTTDSDYPTDIDSAVIGSSSENSNNSSSGNGYDSNLMEDDKYKVSLREYNTPDKQGFVVKVMPSSIQVSQSAEFSPIRLLHHPGEIYKYVTSSSMTINFDIVLVSRTILEARENQEILLLLKSWTKNYYGSGTQNDAEYGTMFGSDPPVLVLSAYGERNLAPVKVRLESVSYSFSNDVDYISTDIDETGQKDPMPTIMTVSVNFKESWSPEEYSNFDLRKYRAGIMPISKGTLPSNMKAKLNEASANTRVSNDSANSNNSVDGTDTVIGVKGS